MSLYIEPSEDKKLQAVLTSLEKDISQRGVIGESTMGILFQFAKRYIAGRDVKEALPVVKDLNNKGFYTTMDNLGEEVKTPDAARKAVDEYLKMLAALKESGGDLNVSVKLTQIGLAIDKNLCRENLAIILQKAKDVGAFVRADMEGSDYTADTLDIVRGSHNMYNNVGIVLQAMLYRTPADAQSLIDEGIKIRLCKGAYKEPSTIAFPDKRDVDRQFVDVSKTLISSRIYHGIATHDERIIEELKQYAIGNNINPNDFEFQMLLGIRPTLQQQLKRDGWRVRVYVPYGRDWFPYTIRRMRERKENFWFVVKNIFRK
ncbi:proline dehydrogenase family protein [bacterium]|nr:proline dehydrogenase family protein [bacterium]